MSVRRQLDLLIAAGLPSAGGRREEDLWSMAEDLPDRPGAIVAVHPQLAPASRLGPLLTRRGKPGFVVVDMTDVDAFTPAGISLPDRPLYLLDSPDRGDHLRNWSPEEALPELSSRSRTPLTLGEGISWLLQAPDRLEPDHCFMCIASRKPKGTSGGYDARTPAIWISGGTGRDGADRRSAPKIGWCWWRNRHTWLGFASSTGRLG